MAGYVYVLEVCGWLCICVRGMWLVMYMCQWYVAGYVYVLGVCGWLCICVRGMWLVMYMC